MGHEGLGKGWQTGIVPLAFVTGTMVMLEPPTQFRPETSFVGESSTETDIAERVLLRSHGSLLNFDVKLLSDALDYSLIPRRESAAISAPHTSPHCGSENLGLRWMRKHRKKDCSGLAHTTDPLELRATRRFPSSHCEFV